jgi:hypothetical protein
MMCLDLGQRFVPIVRYDHAIPRPLQIGLDQARTGDRVVRNQDRRTLLGYAQWLKNGLIFHVLLVLLS